MKNRDKKQRGITLIALVITIIVMLILVSVTITIAVNGGLFNYAKDAVTKTNQAKDAEQELGTGKAKVNGVFDSGEDINAIVDHYKN